MKCSIKKIALPFFALSMSSLYAGVMGPTDKASYVSAKDGLYLGAGIGGSFDQYRFNEKNVVTGQSYRADLNSSQLVGDVFVGYGYTFINTYYIGLELGGNFPSRQATLSSHRGVTSPFYFVSDTFTTTNYLTLDVLPGYRLQPEWLIYGRLGISASNLSFKQYAFGNTRNPVFKDSESQVAGRFGLGATYAVTPHFSASLDYYYTAYQQTSVDWALFSENFTRSSYANFLGVSLTYTV